MSLPLKALEELKKQLEEKWPEAGRVRFDRSGFLFTSGLEAFDRLFPAGGIPYGQLIEITGGVSCGKTGLLWHLLAGLVKTGRVACVDMGHMSFPGAAVACGVDTDRLVVLRPESLVEAGRMIEFLWSPGSNGEPWVNGVFCDLIGQRQVLPEAWCHRLRTRTVRARGLMIFATENNSHVIPPSMVSLRLEVDRVRSRPRQVKWPPRTTAVRVTVTKSRVSPEGVVSEVILRGL